MASLRIELLGHFNLIYQDKPVLIPQARVQSLLAYLVMHCDAPLLREQLAFLFYRDSSEAQARGGLRQLLYGLRQALPELDTLLVIDHRTVQWRAGVLLTVDVAAFSAHLAEAQQAAESPVRRAALERALALYGGELLPACHDDWVLRERERLHQHYLDALEQVSRLCTDQGDLSSALAYAQRLVQADPLQESAYRLLMQLLLRDGDRARALRVYHTCATLLADELGVEPSPETQLLYQQLLNLEAVPVRQPLSVLQPSVRSLVGRQREWEMLLQLWQMTAQGEPRFVLIAGEAGIGKSRLAQELILWAHELNITALQARAYAAEGSLVYAPVLEWLRSEPLGLVLARLDPLWRSEIGRLLPELFILYPDLPRPEPLTEQWQRQRLFEALARAFAAAAPLLLVLDDLQWCDRETLEWLHYLLRFDPKARLMVVGTMRPEEVDAQHTLTRLLLNLRSASQLAEIELDALNAADTMLLAAQVAERELDAESASHLYQTTEGNPLFIVETVRARLQDLGPEGKYSQVSSPAHFATLPVKVQAVLHARLAQLSPAARDVAHLAATIGRDFTIAVLAQASGLEEDVLVRGLDELWQRRLIREQGADAYDFSHDRIREVAYTTVSSARRRLLHRRVALALEQLYAGDLDPISGQLAAHYEHAGLPEQALAFYQRAAEVAQRVYAHAEASSHLSKGVELLGHLPLAVDRRQQELRLQLALGHSLTVLKGPSVAGVSEAFARARVLADEVGDDAQRMHALSGLYLSFLTQGQLLAAHELAQQELLLAQRARDGSMLFKATVNIGYVLAYMGQWRASRSYLEEALAGGNLHWHPSVSYGPIQHPGLACRRNLAYALWHLGYPDQARARLDEVVVQAEALAHPYSLAAALTWSAWLRYYLREAQATQAQAESAIGIARQQGFPMWEAKSTVLAGWAWAHQGRLQEGIARMQQGLAARQAIGTQLYQPALLSMLAETYGQAGQPSQGLLVLNEAFTHIEVTGERSSEAELYRLKGELLHMQGADAQEVESHFRQALTVAQQQEAKSLELRVCISLSRLWQQQGKRRRAHDLLAGVYTWFTEGFHTHDLKEAATLLDSLV